MKKGSYKDWEGFIKNYTPDPVFWYIPKGGSVKDLDHIQKRLRILKKYSNKKWGTVQFNYVKTLEKEGLFKPRAKKQSMADQAAIGRMIKIIFDYLGLAYVDDQSAVLITSAGEEFLKKNNTEDVIEQQLWKFQFWNPNAPKEYDSIRLFPHSFLIRTLLHFPEGISSEEYNLFVCRAKSENDYKKVVELIELWRNTPIKIQDKVLKEIKKHPIISAKSTTPLSVYERIERVRSYAWNFHTASRKHIVIDRQNLLIPKALQESAKARLALHDKESTFIDFQDAKEWFAYYGDYSAASNDLTAMNFYEKREDIHKAVEAYQSAQQRNLIPLTVSVDDYRDARIREKILEDFLEYHMDYLRPGLLLYKERDRNGRQYTTEVGRIDLLARSDEDSWVVIELKRDRAGDKTIGQTLRYIGWVKNNLAQEGQSVSGIIVGHSLDNNLVSAVNAVSNLVSLFSFDFKFTFNELTAQSKGKVSPSTKPKRTKPSRQRGRR